MIYTDHLDLHARVQVHVAAARNREAVCEAMLLRSDAFAVRYTIAQYHDDAQRYFVHALVSLLDLLNRS